MKKIDFFPVTKLIQVKIPNVNLIKLLPFKMNIYFERSRFIDQDFNLPTFVIP